jgi:hypothetical protein
MKDNYVPVMGNSNSGVDAFLLEVEVDSFNPGWSWSGLPPELPISAMYIYIL